MKNINIGELGIYLHKYPFIYAIVNKLWEYSQYSLRIIFIFLRLFKIHPNKIVISNIHGRGYSDHPKYILEEINQQSHEWDIVWILNGSRTDSELPQNIRTVKENSLKSFYELATAKLWIDNAEKRLFVLKRKGQYYLQTWHGFGPKKTADRESIAGHRVEVHLKHNAKMIDAYVSNNELLSSIYRDDFFYSGEILKVGFPRNDVIVNDNSLSLKRKICSKYSIPSDVNIVLYAPTYRSNTDLSIFQIDYEGVLTALENKFGGKWILMLRLHPVIARLSSKLSIDSSNIIDVSHHIDMQELLSASDFLITDYSACMFDFSLKNEPCILCHYDVSEYGDCRGFSITPEELPFPRVHSNSELLNCIASLDTISYKKNIQLFYDKYNMYEPGTASKSIVYWIHEKMK